MHAGAIRKLVYGVCICTRIIFPCRSTYHTITYSYERRIDINVCLMPRIRLNLNFRIVDPAEIFTARVFSNDSQRLEYVTGIENKKKARGHDCDFLFNY